MTELPFKAVGDKLYIEFVNNTQNGRFFETSKGGLHLPRLDRWQTQGRWCRVVSISDQLTEQLHCVAGDYIFLEQMRWTSSFAGFDEKIWLGDPRGVIAVIKAADATDLTRFSLF